MRLFVALRLLSEQHAKQAVEAQNHIGLPKNALIAANVARHHPALKNIFSYLSSTGVLPEMRRGKVCSQNGKEQEADLRLYWCEVETELSADEWYSRHDVEAVMTKDEFVKFTASIRHKSGSHYVVACETYAQTLRIIQPVDSLPKSSRRVSGQAA
jgi:hypothetical protein